MFGVKGSVSTELRSFKALVVNDPARSKQLYAEGEKLIVLAGNGEYAQFKRHVNAMDPSHILAYFSAKALMASLIGGHLMLSTFILENGYPLNLAVGLPHVLHDCLRELPDYDCVSIVKLFISKGFDINMQERESLLAPIHIAVQRELIDTMHEILLSGADVNIVGGEDVMPLSIANQLSNESPSKHLIIEELTKRGARASWRRDSAGASVASGGTTYGTPYTSDTEVRVGGASKGGISILSQPTSHNISCSLPVPVGGDNGESGGSGGAQRVRFNGAQLEGSKPSLPSQGKVRFNGASMQLQPVVATAARAQKERTTLTGASGSALPPVPPKVSVSTASGERLLPPPRVATMESSAGVSTADSVGIMNNKGDNSNNNDGYEQVSDGISHGVESGAVVIAENDINELSSAISSVRLVEVEGLRSKGKGEVKQSVATVGNFELSDDGAAMLFSTG